MPETAPPPDWIHPYCGGCGHNFFGMALVPPDQARLATCNYCQADDRGEEPSGMDLGTWDHGQDRFSEEEEY